MGTNFYWHSPEDTVVLHIGKRSGAGGGLCSFSLQGHREFLDGPISTWQHWRRIILIGGKVFDEYGTEVDRLDFIADVESTTVENRRRQYDWIVDNPGFMGALPEGVVPPADTDDEWLCPDGFSFTFREFS